LSGRQTQIVDTYSLVGEFCDESGCLVCGGTLSAWINQAAFGNYLNTLSLEIEAETLNQPVHPAFFHYFCHEV
jgi:hypothetical protein